jgi:hypothetical protein
VARRLGSQAAVYLTGRNPDRVRAAADRLERAGLPVRPGGRSADLRTGGTIERRKDRGLIAAVCRGLIDTGASRPWFDDMSGAQSPAYATVDVVELALGPPDPTHYGQLVQHGRVIPWN